MVELTVHYFCLFIVYLFCLFGWVFSLLFKNHLNDDIINEGHTFCTMGKRQICISAKPLSATIFWVYAPPSTHEDGKMKKSMLFYTK